MFLEAEKQVNKAAVWYAFDGAADGSLRLRKEASQARASAVEHATDGTDGTHAAAVADGKCSSKMLR